jgi:hypothetical protein
MHRVGIPKLMTLTTKYRLALGFFIVGLILSGVTAFPLACEMRLLTGGLGIDTSVPPETHVGIAESARDAERFLTTTRPWIQRVW